MQSAVRTAVGCDILIDTALDEHARRFKAKEGAAAESKPAEAADPLAQVMERKLPQQLLALDVRLAGPGGPTCRMAKALHLTG